MYLTVTCLFVSVVKQTTFSIHDRYFGTGLDGKISVENFFIWVNLGYRTEIKGYRGQPPHIRQLPPSAALFFPAPGCWGGALGPPITVWQPGERPLMSDWPFDLELKTQELVLLQQHHHHGTLHTHTKTHTYTETHTYKETKRYADTHIHTCKICVNCCEFGHQLISYIS